MTHRSRPGSLVISLVLLASLAIPPAAVAAEEASQPEPARLVRAARMIDPASGEVTAPAAVLVRGETIEALDPETAPANHSNLVRFDESAMASGIALYSGFVVDRLGS